MCAIHIFIVNVADIGLDSDGGAGSPVTAAGQEDEMDNMDEMDNADEMYNVDETDNMDGTERRLTGGGEARGRGRRGGCGMGRNRDAGGRAAAGPVNNAGWIWFDIVAGNHPSAEDYTMPEAQRGTIDTKLRVDCTTMEAIRLVLTTRFLSTSSVKPTGRLGRTCPRLTGHP